MGEKRRRYPPEQKVNILLEVFSNKLRQNQGKAIAIEKKLSSPIQQLQEAITWLTEENIALKKHWECLARRWMEPTIRDEVVATVTIYKEKTALSICRLLALLDLSPAKFYDWQNRFGVPNRHNGKIPKTNWLLPWKIEAIVNYARRHEAEGYRRLCYRMIDEDVVSAVLLQSIGF